MNLFFSRVQVNIGLFTFNTDMGHIVISKTHFIFVYYAY